MNRTAAVSAALRPLVAGPCSTWRVLASFPRAVYLQAEGPVAPPGLLALVTSDGVAHPNAAVVAAGVAARPLSGFRVGRRVGVGEGRIDGGTTVITVSRWWDPEPVAPACSRAGLAASTVTMRGLLDRAAAPPERLVVGVERILAAARAGDVVSVERAGARLLGWGPGLTPSGDDVLCGLLVACRTLTRALDAGDPGGGTSAAAVTLEAATAHLVAAARDATTAVSYALLWHAARGNAAGPVAAVVRALAGAGRVADHLPRLLAVGSSSGRDLAVGILAGARLALGPASSDAHLAVPDGRAPVPTGGPR